MWGRYWITGVLFFLAGCDAFEYSPNQAFDANSEVALNQRNINRLLKSDGDDTITIAFVGDSQRFYDELELFIDKVNQYPEVDFVLLAGDITDFGLLQEYELVHDRLTRINKPYIGVVGNHDVLANGEETFERMYGPLNQSFIYKNVKFILHNTNGREYPDKEVPDLEWLSSQFNADDDSKFVIPVSHIPPFDPDFDSTLETGYSDLMRKHKVLISLHGHIHQFKDGFPYGDGIRYMTSPSFDTRSFVMLKIVNGKVFHQLIDY